MKTFEIKETKIKLGDKFLNYKDLIFACLDHQPQAGFSMQDQRDRRRIREQLEETKSTTIKFEDADAENLKSIVPQMHWNVLHGDIVDFDDAIKEM